MFFKKSAMTIVILILTHICRPCLRLHRVCAGGSSSFHPWRPEVLLHSHESFFPVRRPSSPFQKTSEAAFPAESDALNQVIIGGTVWDLRMPSVILQHVDSLANAHIVSTADPGVSIAYTLDARSQVPHEPGLQRHVQVRLPCRGRGCDRDTHHHHHHHHLHYICMYLHSAFAIIMTGTPRCWT